MKQTDMAAQADSTPLPGRQPTLDVLARLHEDACAFYTARLFSERPDADRVLALLERRAVAPRTVAGFELGYAPPGWTALVDQLHAVGYTAAELLDAGLALTTRQGTLVDRFRDRLMFPVRDPSGQRVIAFIGRALHPAEQTPKYLNSPETRGGARSGAGRARRRAGWLARRTGRCRIWDGVIAGPSRSKCHGSCRSCWFSWLHYSRRFRRPVVPSVGHSLPFRQ